MSLSRRRFLTGLGAAAFAHRFVQPTFKLGVITDESVRLLSAIPDPNFALNWDPGNAFAAGEKAYSTGYNMLPKNRILHMHVKDVRRDPATGKTEWRPMGQGELDYAGQFKALLRDGYRHAVSLETHWRVPSGNPEESTRISMRGLKDRLGKAGAT